jgi:DNA polymerase-1
MELMVLDGNSIVNRAFYGIRLLSTKEGVYTNAVFGFLNILLKLLNEENPDALCVAFDLKAPTFRHDQFEGYKAKRKAMPEELAMQIPILKEVLDAMNIPRYELEGYEADDLIGTIAKRCGNSGVKCVVVTGDKDSLQLIDDTTTVKLVSTRMGQTESKTMTPETFIEEYGFTPEKMVDFKALMGDSSDNIPGVPGIGEKTALDLIRRFGSIKEIYDNIETLNIKDSVRKKLIEGRESAELSYSLATICRDVPLDFEPEGNLRKPADNDRLYELFRKLEFNKLIERLNLTPSPEAAPKAEAPEIATEDISDSKALDELLERCKASEYVSFICRDGLDRLEICTGNKISIVAWGICGDGYNAFLRSFFSAKVTKVSHNLKDTMRLLLAEGLFLEGFVFDTALAAYLISPTDSKYELTSLSTHYLGMELPEAAAAYRLYPVLQDKLSELGMTTLYYEIELPLCAVLAEMEHEGFLIDKKALADFGESLTGEIDERQSRIYRLAGMEFNINSPKQLGEVLFEKLMLPAPRKTKTGYSTNIEVLERLIDKHPIIREIIKYRELTKLKSTYADGLLKVIAPDGRIHTNFQMTVTATGRLSSTEPNLQNIPIRRALGGEIRRMFIASPGKILIDADYSQIELRILAHISGDETMIKAFKNKEDIHAVTASQVFGVAPEEVTPLQRSRAKAVNFGIVYGISAFSLAQDIDVTTSEAKAYISSYLAKYHGVREYMKKVVEEAKRNEYVTTLFGRRRYLPELKSSNFNMRSFGERVALNTPIQGTAADIIKLAMVRVHARLKREGLKAKLLLQVHDELIAEAPIAEAETVKRILTEEMEGVVKLTVPLTAEAHSGPNWLDAK